MADHKRIRLAIERGAVTITTAAWPGLRIGPACSRAVSGSKPYAGRLLKFRLSLARLEDALVRRFFINGNRQCHTTTAGPQCIWRCRRASRAPSIPLRGIGC